MVLFKDKNYFQIFSIPESFSLDPGTLENEYRRLQTQSHPDRFASSSEAEKLQAVQANSLLNEAYEILRSPRTRAAYLLQLHNIDITRVKQADLSQGVLLEQIELREQLEEIEESGNQGESTASLDRMDAMRRDITERLNNSQRDFAEAFSADRLDDARNYYFEMQYFYKLIQEMDSIEDQLSEI